MTALKGNRGSVFPFFLEGSAGRIFAVYHAPYGGKESRRGVLYLPPFAEEMNRSRRMVALQARLLAGLGHGVLMLDLYGTGDSEGEFREARLGNWLADVDLASNWLMAAGHDKVELWGLRFGALLAAAAMERSSNHFTRALFWQPVTNGRQMIAQFLRVALAGSWGSSEQLSLESIRANLSSGRSVEVGGYELSADLVIAIEAMSLSVSVPTSLKSLYWFEVAPDPSDELLPSSRKIVDAWRTMKCDVVARRLTGPQFWSTSETTIAFELLDATSAALT